MTNNEVEQMVHEAGACKNNDMNCTACQYYKCSEYLHAQNLHRKGWRSSESAKKETAQEIIELVDDYISHTFFRNTEAEQHLQVMKLLITEKYNLKLTTKES